MLWGTGRRRSRTVDLSQLPERLGSTVDELRDRTAAAMKADGESVFRELRGLNHRFDGLAERLSDLSSQVDDLEVAQASGFDELVSASRRTTWPRRMLWLGLGLALGTGIAYLADPDRGRSRRAQLSDQLAARARDITEEVTDQAKMAADRTKGTAIETAKDALPEDVPDDPKLLEQRIRSHALGGRDDVADVVVRVDGPGQVALKGTVPSSDSERELLAHVAEVEGVVDVRSELAVRGA
jgi:hyperosmotically inducible periplasmic protein